MEVIVVIIIIVLALMSSQSRKKKQDASGGTVRRVQPARPAMPARTAVPARPARPVTPASPAMPSVTVSGPSGAQPNLPSGPRMGMGEGETMMDWTRPDEEGCFGGSMEHDHTEGESRAEHGEHLAAMREREALEHEAAARPNVLGELDVAALRRAVIVSEVLGKPRALRRQGGMNR